ncbi:hypothetical protein BWK51_05740 [Campylobacter fetus]|uniref:CYTH domain-containing protein n=1 Tax=Campylobacter fetus TaxID=196 RepID=UPI000FCC3A9D|nr:CYTH domain-containing protein [Campylobacter fetus]RUT50108.1 hypothetical protein BWK51_05740 [Campylobacter fetus]
MVLEIERKFLLNNGFIQIALMLEGVEFKKVNILQFYTKIAPNYEVRFRKTANEFIKTIKIGKGLIRQENETVISEKEFQKQRKNSIANQISKSRYIFKLNNFPCNIDIYNDYLSDLAIFEIEFMKKSDADVFILPEFLKNYINKEITFDERYKNKNLALFGLPDFKFNYKKTVKMVEKLNHIKLFFGKNISSYDAIRLTLLQNYKMILEYKLKYLQGKDQSTLTNLRDALRVSYSLMDIFKFTFDEKIISVFLDTFSQKIRKTTELIRANLLIDYTNTASFELINSENYNKQRQILEDETILLLSSDTFEKELKEWNIVLNDEDYFYASNNSTPIKTASAYRLRLEILKTIKSIKRKKNYKQIYKQCRDLRAILWYFGDIFGNTNKMIKNLDNLIENLRFLSQCRLFENAKFKDNDNLEFFKKSLNLKILKTIKKADKKAQKITKKIGKFSKKLKVYYTKEI